VVSAGWAGHDFTRWGLAQPVHGIPNQGLPHPSRAFLREGGPSARTTIFTNARQSSPLSRPALGARPTFHAEFPIWGCPTLPALFAGGWAFCADYSFNECTSNQSTINTSAGGWPNLSRGIPNLGLPHPSRAFCGRVGLLCELQFPRMHVKPVRYQDQRWGLAQPFTRNSQFGVAPPFPRFLREGGPSVRTTISTNARQTSPLSRPALPALHHV
jgi:hypothetical protein